MEHLFNLHIRNLNFLDRTATDVSPAKRVCAYLIDWFLSSLAALFPICMLWSALTHQTETMTQATVFALRDQAGMMPAVLAAIAGLILSLTYMVIIPWKVTPGQTPGKRMMNLQMVSKDGSPLGLKKLLIRQIFGGLLLEGMLYTGSSLLQDTISLTTGLNLTGILTYASLLLTVISLIMAMAAPSRRMLHDYLAGSRIVEVNSARPDQQI